MNDTMELCQLSDMLTLRYRIVSVLGQGGMGKVLLCEGQQGLVAVKVMRLNHELGDSQEVLRQFRQEALILTGIQHPHLVVVQEYIEEDGHGYLVMDYIRGCTLAQLLASGQRLPLQRVLRWAQQLCGVLEYLHGQKILFRDLKPSNVMIDEDDNVRLIDFGIARVQTSGAVTATFVQGMGSTGYSPLEQYQGSGGTDVRSDIYSLGATLFHVLTGKVPPSPIDQVTHGTALPRLRTLNPEIPVWLGLAVHKMLALRKDERYQSAAQAGIALRGLLAEEEDKTEVLTTASAPPRHDPLTVSLAGLLTAVSLGVFSWMFATSAPASPVPLAVHKPAPVLAVLPASSPLPVLPVPPTLTAKGHPLPIQAAALAPRLRSRPVAQPVAVLPALPGPGYPVRKPSPRPQKPEMVPVPQATGNPETQVEPQPQPEAVEPEVVAVAPAPKVDVQEPIPFGTAYPGQPGPGGGAPGPFGPGGRFGGRPH